MKRRRSLQDYVALCKEHFPLDRPVRVRVGRTTLNKDRYPYMRDSGQASQGKNGYYILISDKSQRNDKIDTLIHEWAHCRVDWDEGSEHSDKWGVEYARIRRRLIDEEK